MCLMALWCGLACTGVLWWIMHQLNWSSAVMLAGLDKMVIIVIADHAKFEFLTESFTLVLCVYVYFLAERQYM